MEENLKQIEAVLDAQVRPSLRDHGGEVQVDHLENGVLYIKLMGTLRRVPVRGPDHGDAD